MQQILPLLFKADLLPNSVPRESLLSLVSNRNRDSFFNGTGKNFPIARDLAVYRRGSYITIPIGPLGPRSHRKSRRSYYLDRRTLDLQHCVRTYNSHANRYAVTTGN